MELLFEKNPYVNILAPLTLNAVTGEGRLHLEGRRATKGHRLAVEKCASSDHAESMNSSECARMQAGLYVEVTVLKSSLVATLVIVVGWAYFTAWSVSFYPQILLNIQRKSVIGLNFDFLVLNIVGFLAYSAYNLFMYFDRNVQVSPQKHGL
ncbi:PQ loop repeat protein [Oesophagostomum dentatum]|uniref:PQ loop repeat protein n=1 Tax=Oesophagostomum dentatum TaxID=61180 RepID=A0A0B1SDG6_OESDE|nr:PQ loop repeat protein [Oesophagostomum dentatum]